jgi:transitional endoplasmic reticulum ATPase
MEGTCPEEETEENTAEKTTEKAPDKIITKKTEIGKLPDSDKLLWLLASMTDGYVGADIESVCREAAMITLREDINAKTVSKKAFIKVLNIVRPSVTKDVIEEYKNLKDQFSAAAARQMKMEKPAYFG